MALVLWPRRLFVRLMLETVEELRSTASVLVLTACPVSAEGGERGASISSVCGLKTFMQTEPRKPRLLLQTVLLRIIAVTRVCEGSQRSALLPH